MANFNKILARNEKKLDISAFIPDELKELDEEGVKKNDDYITIKKIPHKIKTKLKFISQSTFQGEKGKEVLKIIQKKLKEKELSTNEMSKMTPEDQLDLMLDFNLGLEDQEHMGEMTSAMEKYILEYGVDPLKHSLVDDEGKSIIIDSDLWDCVPDALTSFVINQIKIFSKGFSLGE